MRRSTVALILGSWGLASCAGRGASPHVAPGTGLASEPRGIEEPHAVGLPDGGVAVAWGSVREDGSADILLARVAGDRVGLPVRVNGIEGSAVAGRQVGPRLAPAGSGRLLVSWVDRARDPAGDILLAASEDGGRSFGPPVRVNSDPGLAGQEYHDIAVLPGGDVAIVWLDERDAPPSTPNQKQLYLAVSRDGGRTFGADRRLTESPAGVCPCCRPALAASPGGSLHVVYRDREGEVLVTRSAAIPTRPDGAIERVTVSGASWRSDACPVDGPAILAGAAGEVRVAWMDASSGEETLWAAASADGGRSFGAARPLVHAAASGGGAVHDAALKGGAPACCRGAIDAVPGRPVLARGGAGAGAVAAWEDASGGVWVAALDGSGREPVRVAGGDDSSARSVSLALDGKGCIHVFWTEHLIETGAIDGAPRSMLGHAVLMDLGGSLTLRDRGGRE